MSKQFSKKNRKKHLQIITGTIIIFLFILAYFPIQYIGTRMTALAAKHTCSLMNISSISMEDAKKELCADNPLQKFTTINYNPETKSVEAALFGLFRRKAVYRPPLGAVLIFPGYESIIEAFPKPESLSKLSDNENYTFNKKTGSDQLKKMNIDVSQINKALSYSFNEFDDENSSGLTRGILVIWKDNIIAERYIPGISEKSRLISWSMAKSILNLAIGRRIQQGAMSLDAANLYPEWGNDNRSKITIQELLRMESNLKWDEISMLNSNVVTMLAKVPDMANYTASFKRKSTPGNIPQFLYSSGTSNILSQLLRRSFDNDQDYVNFLWNDFLNPLGIYNAELEFDASGTWIASSYFFGTTHDLAHFAKLLLNNGKLNGKQFLPKNWIKQSLTPTKSYKASTVTDDPDGMSYGMHWWINKKDKNGLNWMKNLPEDTVLAKGHFGQYLIIIPSKQLIVVRYGFDNKKDWDANYFVSLILSALPS